MGGAKPPIRGRASARASGRCPGGSTDQGRRSPHGGGALASPSLTEIGRRKPAIFVRTARYYLATENQRKE